ncbi:GNAT family N-acetyltransferase [Agromyces sp. NPDC058484]|uniref:GNAT family N-acetyltransferase n=1 Tax=Agromyces sp. NPDC058484 TaxID=3346524 RepID=UPI0036617E8F
MTCTDQRSALRHAISLAGRMPRRVVALRRPRWMRGPRLPNPVHAPRLQTERLVLRPHRLSDAPAWFALQSDPRVIEFLPWPLRNRRESLRHLAHRIRHVRLEQNDDFLALGVELDGILIGDVSLHLRDIDPERHAEIGWIIGSRRGMPHGVPIGHRDGARAGRR